MTAKLESVLAGFAGGIIPTVLVLAVRLNNASTASSNIFSSGFFVGGVLLGVIGGLVVWIYKEEDRRKAFTLGLGAPALITSLVAGSRSENSAGVTAHSARVFSLLTSAYAESVLVPPITSTESIPARNLVITGGVASGNVRAEILNDDGQKLATFVTSSTTQTIPLSNQAATVKFYSGDSKPVQQPLSQAPGSVSIFAIDRNTTRQVGFFQALGAPVKEVTSLAVKADVRKIDSGSEGWVKINDALKPAVSAPSSEFTVTRAIELFGKTDGSEIMGTLLPGDEVKVLNVAGPEGWKKFEVKKTTLMPALIAVKK